MSSSDFDGVQLRARLLAQDSDDGKRQVVTDWILRNSSSAELALRIQVADRESETRTLKPRECMHLDVPVEFGARSTRAGKHYVTPSVTASGHKCQLVSMVSVEQEGGGETTIATTSPGVVFELVEGSEGESRRSKKRSQ